MNKRQLKGKEISEVIHTMYGSEPHNILIYHETADKGVEYCINRTIADFVLNDVKIYALENNGHLIAYFGEQPVDGMNWLTGFMILPEMRKSMKAPVWKAIVNHFNGNFKTGIYSKNNRARSYLMKFGCKLIEKKDYTHGPSEIFEYKENV